MARSISTATRWPTITPHDTNRISTGKPVAIMCGATAGNVVIVDGDGNVATVPIEAGEIKQVQPLIVKATGTTATPIYGLYNE